MEPRRRPESSRRGPPARDARHYLTLGPDARRRSGAPPVRLPVEAVLSGADNRLRMRPAEAAPGIGGKAGAVLRWGGRERQSNWIFKSKR